MQITWYGQACIRLQGKESAVVFDPFQAVTGLKVPKLSARVVCVSHDHDDHNNVKAVSGDPFVITTPGEYEVGGIFVYGLPSFHDATQGKERGANTIFAVEFEDIHITHLGDLGTTELTEQQLELIEGTDILFIPVGGTYTIDGKQAVQVIQKIEPRIIIPIHYKIPHLKYPLDDVAPFLKAQGAKNGEALEVLKIQKKDLPQNETQTIVLAAHQ